MPSFSSFVDSLLGKLNSPTLTKHGNLNTYLSLPSADRSNDEADIVDRCVTETLLASLGYVSGNITHDRQKNMLRPDFIVHLPSYPSGPCFIVEDKSTVTDDLEVHETQLQGYFLSFRASRGLLNNGRTLIGYDNISGTPEKSLELDLVGALSAWRAASGKNVEARVRSLPTELHDSLLVLWNRYSVDTYSDIATLIDDLTLVRGKNEAHSVDGSTWIPSKIRIPITSAKTDPGKLTEAIKDLIRDIELDARVQYRSHAQAINEYDRELHVLPGDSRTIDDRIADLKGRLQIIAGLVKMRDVDAILHEFESVLRGNAHTRLLHDIEARVVASAPKAGTASTSQPAAVQQALLAGEQDPPILDGLEAGPPGPQANGPAKSGRGKSVFPLVAELMRDANRFCERFANHKRKLAEKYRTALTVRDAYRSWRAKTAMLVIQSADEERLINEFLAQTAYLIIVRMLLVRIMEDKGLTPRMFTNGGTSLWFQQVEPHYFATAVGQSTGHLLDIAYTSARQLYAHFYDDRLVFNWYHPDRNTVIRVLHRLAGFDLRAIDHDIIGRVYNDYLEREHKHDTGLYYTPPEVIAFILDQVGFNTRAVVTSRLLDPACGSGAFLVAAAQRIIEQHADYFRSQGHATIPDEELPKVVQSVVDNLYGLDLNPFACALAETNLLIQVLDLVAQAKANGIAIHIDRFNIYNTDTLAPSHEALLIRSGPLEFSAEELPVEEQIKIKRGRFFNGFDFVVGNPPYIRADLEGSAEIIAYRQRIKELHPEPLVQDVLTLKWDIYIAFMAVACSLLKDDGFLGMIVSSAFETVPYAAEIRARLSSEFSVKAVDFFPNLKLFTDAVVQNTIVTLAKHSPNNKSKVMRRWHNDQPPSVFQYQRLRQLRYDGDIFRQALPKWTKNPPSVTNYADLADIAYVSKGMVLHGTDGGGNKFSLDDLISDKRDGRHPVPYVRTDDLEDLYVARFSYLEYGRNLRAPAHVYRATFPELYDRDKIIVGRFGGMVLDNGSLNSSGHLYCNHTLIVLVRWSDLKGVNNRAIDKAVGAKNRSHLEHLSASVSLEFLFAYLLSDVAKEVILGAKRTALKGETQPRDYSELIVPLTSKSHVSTVQSALRPALKAARDLESFVGRGWTIRQQGKVITPPSAVPTGIMTAPFSTARVSWNFIVRKPTADAASLRLHGSHLCSGNTLALEFDKTTPAEAREWLTLQLSGLPPGTKLSSLSSELIPRTPSEAKKAFAAIQRDRSIINGDFATISNAIGQINKSFSGTFTRQYHPPVHPVP